MYICNICNVCVYVCVYACDMFFSEIEIDLGKYVDHNAP